MEITLDPINHNGSSCRICLEDDSATIPLFDEDNMRVLVMFNNCFNEKLEHVPGFPELVCDSCYKTIETASSFIERYRATQQTLLRSIKNVKQEYIDEDDFTFPETDSIEDDIFELQYTDDKCNEDDIKTEPKCDDDDEKPLSTIKNGKLKGKTTSGRKTNSKKSKKETNIFEELNIEGLFKDRPDLTIVKTDKSDKINKSNKSNSVASSLLEGVFQWNGEDCAMKKRIKSPKVTTVVKKEKYIKKPKSLKERPKKVYLCDECGANFEKNDHLRRHKERHTAPAVCNICNKKLLNERSLMNHIRDVHNSEQVICPICARIFKHQKTLRTHMRFMHEGKVKKKLRRLPCTLCEKTFAADKFLTMHMRSVHTGERPEICKVCGKGFTHEDYLKEHMRLHTGETPFKCPVCGRGYAQRCNMKSHIVHNHRLSQIDPDLLAKIKPNYTRLMRP